MLAINPDLAYCKDRSSFNYQLRPRMLFSLNGGRWVNNSALRVSL